MEDSEKRRERLKAMRLEADQAVVSSDAGTSSSLTNPLIESSSTTQSVQSNSFPAPRFDYYTDPMAAFTNKKTNNVSHPGPQESSNNATPSPVHRPNTYAPDPRNFQSQGAHHYYSSLGPQEIPPGTLSGPNTYSPDPRMFQPQGIVYHNSPRGNPMPRPGPYGPPQVYAPGGFNGSHTYSPDQRMIHPPGVYPSHYGPPRPDPSNFARGGNFPGPSFNHGQRPQGRGGQRFINSPNPGSGRGGFPYPNSGRGRSQWSNQGGRGRSGSSSVSEDVSAEYFYNRSMIEDPWDQMKPVLWISKSMKSWVPNSISVKKSKVAEDSNRSTSEPSLAEYLAASFNEAIDNTPPNN